MTRPGDRPLRIALFGNFGTQNIGNECTLQAMIANIRHRLPQAELYSICTEPGDTAARHGIPAVPIHAASVDAAKAQARPPSRSVLSRLVRLLSVRIPGELAAWGRAVRTLRGTSILAMTGTGMLTDASESPFGLCYDVFKWACAARLSGCRVRFVAVGVGPFYKRLSERFIRAALSLADYRSYRDDVSKARVDAIGFDTSRDSVVPDLAFSLPPGIFPPPAAVPSTVPVIGVGVMDYYGPGSGDGDGESIHRAYLDKMRDFVAWLLEQGYAVRILHGDVLCDGPVRQRLRAALEQRGVAAANGRLLDEDIASVEQLLSQLAATDAVVSPRYHNLLLALMLEKPVISISYDAKNDALLQGVGLGEYRQEIGELDVSRLIAQFERLREESPASGPELRRRLEQYRRTWDAEYSSVLAGVTP